MITNILSALGMMIAGLLFFLIPRARLRTNWWPFLFGALTWVVAVALKFAWAVPLNTSVYHGLQTALGTGAGSYVFYVYVGLLTGIFECGVIYLAVRYLPAINAYDSKRALAFGYGFGAFEALLLGLGVLASALLVIFFPDTLSADIRAQFGPMDWALAPSGTVERIATVFVHAFTTWLVFYAVRSSRTFTFWLAFVFKSAIDAFAAWAQLDYGLTSVSHIWTVEAVVVGFGAVSVWGLYALRRRWAEIPDTVSGT